MSECFDPSKVIWSLPYKNPKIVNNEESEEYIQLVEYNLNEISNWVVYFLATAGKGVIAFEIVQNGYSFPPRYLTGKQLKYFKDEEIISLNNYDEFNEFYICFLDENKELISFQKHRLPAEIIPYNPEMLGFNSDYTKEEDDSEIINSRNQLFNNSQIEFENDNLRIALSCLNKLTQENPLYSRAYSARGCIYENMLDKVSALGSYFDALEVNPENWRAMHNISCLFSEIGEYSLAALYGVNGIEIFPHFINGICNTVDIFCKMNLEKTAIVVLDYGLEINHGNKTLQKLKYMMDLDFRKKHFRIDNSVVLN